MMSPPMRRLPALVLLLAASLPVPAQEAVPAAPAATPAVALPAPPETPRPLQPFVATYQVFHEGHELGMATLQAVPLQSPRWRVDLTMQGQGLMRLTGLNLQQSTLFDYDGTGFRPLTQATVRRAFLSRHKTVGVYDWNARTAHWTGDVKAGHAGPVGLQDGDMSGLLIDLALIRDAAPGRTLHYRFVDDGRMREHLWQVAPDTENVSVGGSRTRIPASVRL